MKISLQRMILRRREKAPEGPQNVARGQSDEGAATPGQGDRNISKPQRGGSSFARQGVFCRPSGAWGKIGAFQTRGRRSFVALTPGYILAPLRGYFATICRFIEEGGGG
jgi:hypothetical protein